MLPDRFVEVDGPTFYGLRALSAAGLCHNLKRAVTLGAAVNPDSHRVGTTMRYGVAHLCLTLLTRKFFDADTHVLPIRRGRLEVRLCVMSHGNIITIGFG